MPICSRSDLDLILICSRFDPNLIRAGPDLAPLDNKSTPTKQEHNYLTKRTTTLPALSQNVDRTTKQGQLRALVECVALRTKPTWMGEVPAGDANAVLLARRLVF